MLPYTKVKIIGDIYEARCTATFISTHNIYLDMIILTTYRNLPLVYIKEDTQAPLTGSITLVWWMLLSTIKLARENLHLFNNFIISYRSTKLCMEYGRPTVSTAIHTTSIFCFIFLVI